MNDAGSGAPRRPDPTDRLGIGLAIGSAIGLGLAIAMSRYAYNGGANGITIATVRTLFGFALLAGFCIASGRRMLLPRREAVQCIWLGVLMSAMFYGNVGAVEFISVGLAALLFYTYPPMIAILHTVVSRERPSAMKILAITLAFGGLALMLEVSRSHADPLGIALSLIAAASTAAVSVWLAHRLYHVDPVVVTVYMCGVGSVALLAAIAITSSVALPGPAIGWFGLAAVVVLQSCGAPVFFAAVQRVGALKCAMIANIQPLASIGAAYLLFGERLSGIQLAGGGLVLGGIWLMQWQDRRVAPVRSG